MAQGEGGPKASNGGVSIEDFKKFESSMATQLDEMREMFKQLMTSRASVPPSTEDHADDVDHTFAGEPQEEGMMQQSSSFPWFQNHGLSNQYDLEKA